jgi:hypothetical protein
MKIFVDLQELRSLLDQFGDQLECKSKLIVSVDENEKPKSIVNVKGTWCISIEGSKEYEDR